MVTLAIEASHSSHTLPITADQPSAAFRALHVSAEPRTKSCFLTVYVQSKHPALDGLRFKSSPITIISKPSKKTVKLSSSAAALASSSPMSSPAHSPLVGTPRSLGSASGCAFEPYNPSTSCIEDGSLIALFNRINSQTVRTRYLFLDTHDSHQIIARNDAWSPLRIQLLHDPAATASPRVVRYGSIVQLLDPETHRLILGPVRIRRSDRGVLLDDATAGYSAPVGQMQKVVLEQINTADPTWALLPSMPPSTNDITFVADSLNVPDHLAWTMVSVHITTRTVSRLSSPTTLLFTPVGYLPHLESAIVLRDSELEFCVRGWRPGGMQILAILNARRIDCSLVSEACLTASGAWDEEVWRVRIASAHILATHPSITSGIEYSPVESIHAWIHELWTIGVEDGVATKLGENIPVLAYPSIA